MLGDDVKDHEVGSGLGANQPNQESVPDRRVARRSSWSAPRCCLDSVCYNETVQWIHIRFGTGPIDEAALLGGVG